MCLCSGVPSLHAIPPALTEAVPADALAVYLSSGPDHTDNADGNWSAIGVLAFLADQASRKGLLAKIDSTCRLWLDVFTSWSVVSEQPAALVLLDITGKQRTDGGHELAGLRAAVILHTRGHNERIERRIQYWLTVHTNDEHSKLTVQSHDGGTTFRLRDRRLPSWATFSWGAVGEYYILAVGSDAHRSVTEVLAGRAKSLARDPWFAASLDRVRHARPRSAWYVRAEKLGRRGDPQLARKIDNVQKALDLGGAQRGLWTVSRKGRSIEISSAVRRNGDDEAGVLASDSLLHGVDRTIIPDDASGFAVLDVDPSALVARVRDAYLAAKSPPAQESARAFWHEVEVQSGLSIEADILPLLRGPVVIHDSPRHPLRLPLALTILVPVREDPAALRVRLDRLLSVGQHALGDSGALRLIRDQDDVWYLDFGLAGPAVLVTDRWLILSFSPSAVRQNAKHLATRAPLASGDSRDAADPR